MRTKLNTFLKLAIGLSAYMLDTGLSIAQLQHTYIPKERHSALSTELIRELEFNLDEENVIMAGNKEVRKINFSRKSFFLAKVREGAFIKDDSLENYVNNVLNKIVTENALTSHPRRGLILASPHLNAVCFGQGIYAVTIGLLARLENENQLAFILAHEIAHDELGHIRKRVAQEAEMDLAEKTEDQVNKIVSGNIIMDDINEFRRLVYSVSRYSRKNEMLADSMSVALMTRAAYNGAEASSALSILQSAQSPKQEIGAELFLPFHSPDYPFQDYWLNDRLTVFSKKYSGNFLYSSDSVESHPTIALRQEALRSYSSNFRGEQVIQPAEFVSKVTETAAFETVETAYREREYDLCMYYAMQLYYRYPNNAYLVSRMGKVLLDLYEARGSNRYEEYVSKYTTNYCEELKLINSFLNNLTSKELGEVVFHFLSNGANFDDQQQSHHYLLWKISVHTYRNDVKDKVRQAFKEKFGTSISSYRYD